MEAKQFNAVLKQVKFPRGAALKTSPDGKKVDWSVKGGFAGGKAIERLVAGLEEAGFVLVDSGSGSSPDGSTTNHGTSWTKGNVTVGYRSRYGTSASDNRFSAWAKVNEPPVQG